MVFSVLWFGFLSFVTILSLRDFQEENYVLVIFWLAGFFHLGTSLNSVFTKHIIQFTRDSIKFINSTPFSTNELQLGLIEVEKVHGNQALSKHRFRYKKMLDEPKKIKRGIIVLYSHGSRFELGEHLSREDQLYIARYLNERIQERKKFLR
jgi:hypothetical protein